jgi:hypothetical protein
MFVARSAARVRLARLAFLVLCLAPFAGLTAWAVRCHSEAHRAALEQRWRVVLGVPLTVASVEHPRPGVTRLHDVAVPAAGGGAVLRLPLVELESSADEDRLRVEQFRGTAEAAAVLATLARDWLTDDVRFRRTCLIEVADFDWEEPPAGGPEMPAAGHPDTGSLRIECVARSETRALRIVRRAATTDEVRIVRRPRLDQAGDAAPATVSISAECQRPLPLGVVAVAAGVPLPWAAACRGAAATGTLDAEWTDAGWSGTARGRIAGLSLAAAAATVGGRGTGTAEVGVTKLEWKNGRVTTGLFECSAGPGSVDGRLFDRVVLALGARPGPAAGPLPPDGDRLFDTLACLIGIGPHGVQILPAASMPAAVAVRDRDILLLPPLAAVPGERVAWLLSAPGTSFGPAAGPGAWLISVLPGGGPPQGESATRF